MKDEKAAVIGLARAGVPAARFLAERGHRVIGYDNRTLEQLGDEAQTLHDVGIELRTGEHGYAGLEACSLVVLSPGLKIHYEPLRSVLEKCEARGAEVIGELELAARHCPAPIIAVTGTKGKSTTVKLIAEMLQACGLNAIRAGNTGIPLIAELPRLSSDSWAVVEVSSFQLERAPTFRPRIAVLLNLLADHQDYHPSLEQYWGTKLKLFANQTEGDTAIFNRDDPRVDEIWDERGPFGGLKREWKSTFLDSSGRVGLRRQDCLGWVCRQGDSLGFIDAPRFKPVIRIDEIPLHGEHNLSNVAAAILAADAALGEVVVDFEPYWDRKQVIPLFANAIRNFQSLPHRLEIVSHAGGITWVNDSQATIPDAAVRALAAFPPPVTLIAGGRAKIDHPGAFDELGRAVAERAHLLLTIGEAATVIADAARRAGFAGNRIVDAKILANAVREAHALTPPGGTVVMSPACASFDQFTSFEARGEAFRATVREFDGTKNFE